MPESSFVRVSGDARSQSPEASNSRLFLGLGFLEPDHAIAFFPLAALAQQLNAFKSFENGAAFQGSGSGGFVTIMLRHVKLVKR